MRLRVEQRSPHRNIYHCCTQKTASQWFRQMFTSASVFDYTGLRLEPYTALGDAHGIGLRYADIRESFPRHSLVAHLYIDRSTYDSIPKPGSHKAFFVMRDPRDIVVSWYFHAKSPRTADVGPVALLRDVMKGRNFEEGFRNVIDMVESWGTFAAARSWLEPTTDPRTAVFRYEDLVADNGTFIGRLFDHLDIAMPTARFEELVERFSFERVSGGRRPGEEDSESHLRKGVAGDWKNHFTPALTAYFREATDDVATSLGYNW